MLITADRFGQGVHLTLIPSGELQFNPFTPISDQDRISPYNINTISGSQVKE